MTERKRKTQTIDGQVNRRGEAKPNPNFVSAGVPAPVRRQRPNLPADMRHERTMNVTPHATQQIIVKTSSTDQARAFEIRTRSLAAVMGGGMVILSTYSGWIEFFSLGAIVVFGLTFAGVWFLAYSIDMIVSPGFVTLFEAVAKWWLVFLD